MTVFVPLANRHSLGTRWKKKMCTSINTRVSEVRLTEDKH